MEIWHYYNTKAHFMKQIPQDMKRLMHIKKRRTKLRLSDLDNHRLEGHNQCG